VRVLAKFHANGKEDDELVQYASGLITASRVV
jgi:hypothetical protein